MNSSLQRLAQIYHQLDEVLPKSAENRCGTCRECCTEGGVDRHGVTELEYDYISETYGATAVDHFRAFASREKKTTGDYRWELCPFYDTTAPGCGIYDHRPFSCRVFGHYQVEGTELPTVCTFRGRAKVVSGREHYVEVPLAVELRDASRAYWASRKSQPVRQTSQANELKGPDQFSLLSEFDPVDRAFMAQARGDHEAAVQELTACLPNSDHQPYLLFYIGQSLMFLERYAEALEVYREALRLSPESWELTYSLGVAFFRLGDFQDSFRSFVQTIELNPEHSLAWGFLGYMTLSDGLLKEAAVFFDNALGIDPENAMFRMRLGVILAKLGYPKEARTLLESALAIPAPENVHSSARKAMAMLDMGPATPTSQG